jgi:hypothetical protein
MSQPSHPYPALNALIGINGLCAVLCGAAGAIGFLVALASSDLLTGMISVLGGLTATVSFIASAELIVLLLRAKAELTDIREYVAGLSSSAIAGPGSAAHVASNESH